MIESWPTWLAVLLLLAAWVAWWLGGVNWPRTWAYLAEGAWVPAALLLVLVALAWSQIAPSDSTVLGILVVGNFWWQLGAVALLAGLALFCGWLQGVFGWGPAEVPLEPPVDVTPAVGHDLH